MRSCPPGAPWTLRNAGDKPARLHWIRKLYEPAPGWPLPEAFVTNEQDKTPAAMPGTQGRWATTRFVAHDNLSHDMQVNIVTFQPGGLIPFEETHVMEHGLYVLEGKAVYKLNSDWVEVEAGDFMWLRAFCPQACYAAGPGRSGICCTRTSTATPNCAARGRSGGKKDGRLTHPAGAQILTLCKNESVTC